MKYVRFLALFLVSFLVAGAVFAETGEAGTAAASGFNSFAIGAAIIMAFASGLGTIAQSRAASAALEGIARNPQAAEKVVTPLILSLALMESLVIFAFVISILLWLKIGWDWESDRNKKTSLST